MDKRQIIAMITDVLKSLTQIDPVVSFEDDMHINAIVISDNFEGMTFTTRFRQLDTLLRTRLPDIHIKYFFNFEAYTKTEAEKKRKTRSDKSKKRISCNCDEYDYCRIHGSIS